jgi:uncharacterized protein YecE (DUF72 family)/alkylated DNA nucleotide flippase Atl1
MLDSMDPEGTGAERSTSRGRARVGCSGYVYPDWRGIVYPEGSRTADWFSIYAARFDTVELNTTFYRLPTTSAVEQWAAQAPPGFLYAAKLGAFGTHRKKLRDAAGWLPNHLDRVRRLGRALGPNLVQLPPRWKRNTERLDEFLTLAPTDIRWAVELRDPSWIHDDVFAVLERHGAALCIHDLLPRHPWLLTTSWTYLRFHGPDAQANPYHGRYGGRRLGRASRTIRGWLDTGTDVFAYFNNDFEGHAVVDAEWLRRSIDPEADPPGHPTPGSVVPSPPNADPWSEHHVPTTFQREVVAAIRALGKGDVVTYAEIAEEIGHPGAGQAVANVLRRAPDLPWWRVVPTDGRLYRSHAPTQAPLLEAEGHRIDVRRRVTSR